MRCGPRGGLAAAGTSVRVSAGDWRHVNTGGAREEWRKSMQRQPSPSTRRQLGPIQSFTSRLDNSQGRLKEL